MRAGNNRNGIEAHFKAGGESEMNEASRTGLSCSVALLGGHAQVDTLFFTQECLYTRMADASAFWRHSIELTIHKYYM